MVLRWLHMLLKTGREKYCTATAARRVARRLLVPGTEQMMVRPSCIVHTANH